jgi:hypothetical protein
MVHVAFLAGSLPFSVWVGRFVLGVEIRQFGDGNPGTTNTFRAGSKMAGLPIPPQVLGAANSHFGTALETALELESIVHLEAGLTWVHALLSNQGLSPPALPAYLRAQAKALMGALNKLAAPIADWLEGYASQLQKKRTYNGVRRLHVNRGLPVELAQTTSHKGLHE